MRATRGAVVAALYAGLLVAGAPPFYAQTWTTYTKPEVRLTYSMPCAPEWKTTTAENPSGPSTTHLGMCKAADELYLAAWVDYAPTYRPNIDAELKANQDNFVKSFLAVLLTSTPATHNGMPALDFVAQRQGQYLVTSRVVMDGYRPLMVAIVTPLNQDRSQNIRKFVNAFNVAPR